MALSILLFIGFLEGVLSVNINLDPLPSHYERNLSTLRCGTQDSDHSYRYGHEDTNNFGIGTLISCNEEEKICLSRSMLFLPHLDSCGAIGYNTIRSCFLKIDEQEFTNRSGHIIGMCEGNAYFRTTSHGPCYQLVNDSKFHSKEEIHGICGCDRKPIPHVLGGYECNCSEYTPTHVEQPKEDGMCRIPDLRYPDYSLPVVNFKEYEQNLNCSEKQAECFLENKIWVAEFQNCSDLGEKGNCPDDHILVLNETAAADGMVESICVHQRGTCPVGYKRLAFDKKCYSDRELQLRKINVKLQPFGNYDTSDWFLSYSSYSRTCDIFYPPILAEPPLLEVDAVPGWGVESDSGQISGSIVKADKMNPSLIH